MNIAKMKTTAIISGIAAAAVLLVSFISTFNLYSAPSIRNDYTVPQTFVTNSDHTVSPADTAPPVVEQPVVEEPENDTVKVKYIKILKTTPVKRTASTSAKKVTDIQKNTEVKYMSENENYYKVKYGSNKYGWIEKKNTELFEKEITYKHIPQNITDEPIDLKLTQYADDFHMAFSERSTVGGSVAVIKDGKVCFHYEYGYADKKAKKAVQENTKFRIASVSKVFVAMMSMRAVDDGILDIDKDLSKVMGFKFRNPSYKDVAITQRMLLTHKAGLRDANPIFTGSIRSQTANSRNYYAKPGTKFLYSNLSFGFAGATIEACSKQYLSEYARDKFFKPMGLDASFDAKYLSDKSLVANCYNGSKLEKDNKYLTRSQPWGPPGQTFHLGAGGLLISSEDLASLITVLINDGEYNGTRYLSQESLNEMLRVQFDTSKFQQCLAIRMSDKIMDGRTMYYHNGEAYGIHSLIAYDPKDKSGVAIITSGANASRNDNTVFAVCDEIMKTCYKDLIDTPSDVNPAQ